MLEATKREVREIRSVEAQMRWNLQRQEKRETVLAEKEASEELRDWRWRQSDEMKAYVTEKAKETKVVELDESRNFQEFKREVKTVQREEEKRLIQEEYMQDMENARWVAELASEENNQNRELLQERLHDIRELKDMRVSEKIKEKATVDQDRALEQNLEMANMARALAKEKEKLLQSLQYARQCQKAPPLGGKRSPMACRPSALTR